MALGAVGLIGGLLSTGVALWGQAQQQKAADQAAEYNNTLAQAEATNNEAETAEAIKRQRINNRADMATLRTRMAASGRLLTTGTPLLVLGDAAGAMQLGIADAARASAMQAESQRAQGRMGLWEADVSGEASKLAMAGTALKGFTSVYGDYKEGSYLGMYPRIGNR